MINVLIIEDEHAIRRFLRTALEADALRVYDAATLQRGLLEAATRKPDLIILDLGLPDGDGLALARRLRPAPARTGTAEADGRRAPPGPPWRPR